MPDQKAVAYVRHFIRTGPHSATPARTQCSPVVQTDLTNKIGARQLGYYLFWNLRCEKDSLGLSEDSVVAAAKCAGLKHHESAWNLFDRNGDKEATLDEVVTSVEEVYNNRRSLAQTLLDNQTVVSQVERAIYITLMIVLLFVIVAIFDAGSLQRTWTGLSAGLLSFSFIFGNSIKQVCHHTRVHAVLFERHWVALPPPAYVRFASTSAAT